MRVICKDILTVSSGYILQQTNCVTSKPYGLSADLERTFPGTCPYLIRTEVSTPGTVDLIESNRGPIIANLFGQYYPGGPGRRGDEVKDRLQYFRQALNGLTEYFSGTSKLIQIAIPYKIGCGLAQGDWTVYEKMLEEFEQQLKDKGVNAEITVYKKN